MIIHNIEQHSEAWHYLRCGRVTGTRFKSLMAGETTATYKDLITQLACEIITGQQEDAYVSADMERGTMLEPVAREAYEMEFGQEVKQIGFITPDDSEFADWVGISPDGMLQDGGLLEIKCPKYKTHLEYIEADKLPSEYRYQVQGQLFVTEAPYCDFMSYAVNMKPFIIRVYPDTELFSQFEIRLRKLIEEVQTKLKIYQNYSHLK